MISLFALDYWVFYIGAQLIMHPYDLYDALSINCRMDYVFLFNPVLYVPSNGLQLHVTCGFLYYFLIYVWEYRSFFLLIEYGLDHHYLHGRLVGYFLLEESFFLLGLIDFAMNPLSSMALVLKFLVHFHLTMWNFTCLVGWGA